MVAIMISAYSTTEMAVQAMNFGAFDFVPKPFDNQELKQAITNALASKMPWSDQKSLSSELKDNLYFGRIIGRSPGMVRIYEMINQVAATTTNVLISGESGTGNELIARTLHDMSDRKDKPFVVVNCGGIPETFILDYQVFSRTL